MSTVQQITAYQAKLRSLPKVHVVMVTLDGERSIHAVYESKELAEMAVQDYNTMKGNKAGYYGKARAEWWPLTDKEAFEMGRR